MKLIKCITQCLMIILVGLAINIYSSTTDESSAQQTEQGAEPSELATAQGAASTQEGRPRKVLSLRDLALGKVASVYNPQYIIGQVNTYLEKPNGLNEAVDYVTGLHLDQSSLIGLLKYEIKHVPQIFVVMPLYHDFIISTIIANKQLHNNSAMEVLQDMLYGIVNGYYSHTADRHFAEDALMQIRGQINKLFEVIAQAHLRFQNDATTNNLYNLIMWDNLIRNHPDFAKFLMQTGAFDLEEILDLAITAENLEVVTFLVDNDLVYNLNEATVKARQIKESHPSIDAKKIWDLLYNTRVGLYLAQKEDSSLSRTASSANKETGKSVGTAQASSTTTQPTPLSAPTLFHNNAELISNAATEITTFLQQDHLQEALNYFKITGLHPDLVTGVLNKLLGDPAKSSYSPYNALLFQLVILTLTDQKKLHDNDMIQALGIKKLIDVIIRLASWANDHFDTTAAQQIYEQISTLIETLAQAQVDFKNAQGTRLLNWAIRLGKTEFALTLLKTGGFNPNIHDVSGKSVLAAAVTASDFPVIEYLLTHNLMKPDELNRIEIPYQWKQAQKGTEPYRIYELIEEAKRASQSTGQASSADQG